MKISVVVPVYNVELYIRECIESILNQTLKDIEIIVVNDGSQDRSITLIEDLINDNDNIVLINKENGGLSSARNEGIKYAKGEYIAFIDSDDYIDENFLEELYLPAKKFGLDISMGNHTKLLVNGEKIKKERKKDLLNNTVIKGNEILYNQFKLDDYRMEVWDDLYSREFIMKNNLNFYERILHEDEEFTARSLLMANKVMLVDTYGYNYRQRDNSIMSSKPTIKSIDSLETILLEMVKIFNKTDSEISKKAISKVCLNLLSSVAIKLSLINCKDKKIIYKKILSDGLVELLKYENKNNLKFLILKNVPFLYSNSVRALIKYRKI